MFFSDCGEARSCHHYYYTEQYGWRGASKQQALYIGRSRPEKLRVELGNSCRSQGLNVFLTFQDLHTVADRLTRSELMLDTRDSTEDVCIAELQHVGVLFSHGVLMRAQNVETCKNEQLTKRPYDTHVRYHCFKYSGLGKRVCNTDLRVIGCHNRALHSRTASHLLDRSLEECTQERLRWFSAFLPKAHQQLVSPLHNYIIPSTLSTL